MRKVTLPLALATCLALPATAVAQNLTKSQEGRAAVGRCYTACIDKAQTTSLALYERAERLSDLLISDEYHTLTDDSQAAVLQLEEYGVCALAQDHVRALDGCYAGCVDVEVAYGVNRAHARSRFHHLYRTERDALRTVGLWSGYENSATSGAAFDAGCDRFWQSDQSANAALSRIASLPARVKHRTAKPVRAKAPNPPVGAGG